MKKALNILILLGMLVLAAPAVAQTLSERSFAELGENGFTIADGQCHTISFNRPGTETDIFVVLSLHYQIPAGAEATITARRPNAKSTTLFEANTRDIPGRFARIELPNAELEAENTLEVCAQTDPRDTVLTVTDQSLVGAYRIPQFTLEKSTEESEPVVGRETRVTVKATNTGSKAANVNIAYKDLELDIAQITRGDAEFSGTLAPGDTQSLSYYIKPKFPVEMGLLPAQLTYENVFGETVTVKSNRPTLQVREPAFKIHPQMTAQQQKAEPGRPLALEVIIENRGNETLEVTVRVEAPQGIRTTRPTFSATLKPQETRRFALEATSTEEIAAEIGCTVTYADYDIVQTACLPVAVAFEKPRTNPVVLVALIFLVIGALAYVYTYHPGALGVKRKGRRWIDDAPPKKRWHHKPKPKKEKE